VRVLFWGTPEFATPPLRALLGEGFDVVGVVTQPDRPVGRSRSKLVQSPVKQIALEEGIPVLQPVNARDPEVVAQIRELEPVISVVVAYGQILPKDVIDLPMRGTLNIHASLLPVLRGAAPIQAAIRQGFTQTGVTIMQMIPRLDAGPILSQIATPIAEDETYGELQARLSELGASALIEALALLSVGALTPQEQDESMASYAPRIDREAARVDWTEACESVCRAIRAYDPKPGSFSTLDGLEVRLFGARHVRSAGGEPGEVLGVDESGMLVACGEGAVRISYVHPAGRKRVSALQWSHGRGVRAGDSFGDAIPGARPGAGAPEATSPDGTSGHGHS
jgi:methionyl-tRNA formyltransferase